MRVTFFIIMFLIVLPTFTVKAADEPLSKEQTMNELANDLARLEQMVQDTNFMIQQFQTARLTGAMPSNLTVTSQKGIIRKGAGQETAELTTVKQGESLKVIDKAGDWYAVTLDTPVQGLETGWISSQEAVPAVTPFPITEASFKSFVENKIKEILAIILEIKEEYKNNQYIRVSSFSIGVPLGIQVEIEIKE